MAARWSGVSKAKRGMLAKHSSYRCRFCMLLTTMMERKVLRSMHHTTPALSACTLTTALMEAAQRDDTDRQSDRRTDGQAGRQAQ